MERVRIAALLCKFHSVLRLLQLGLEVVLCRIRGAALAVVLQQQMQASAVVFQNRKPA